MTNAVTKSVGKELVTGILIFLGAGMSAHATPMQASFNFGSPLANNAGPTAIKAYMDPLIAAAFGGGTHTVTVSAGAIAQNGSSAYAGEGYVVGLGGSTTAYTLAVKDGGFLMNNGPTYNEFDLTFSDAIDSVSFDYEIFPDGSGQTPDFIFKAGASNPANFSVVGTVPVSPNNKSVNHPSGSGEPNKQLIGSTGVLNLNIAGGTMLQFIDWPPEVAISNLTVKFHTPGSVPEPASIFLFGSSLVACVTVMRRKMRKV